MQKALQEHTPPSGLTRSRNGNFSEYSLAKAKYIWIVPIYQVFWISSWKSFDCNIAKRYAPLPTT